MLTDTMCFNFCRFIPSSLQLFLSPTETKAKRMQLLHSLALFRHSQRGMEMHVIWRGGGASHGRMAAISVHPAMHGQWRFRNGCTGHDACCSLVQWMCALATISNSWLAPVSIWCTGSFMTCPNFCKSAKQSEQCWRQWSPPTHNAPSQMPE